MKRIIKIALLVLFILMFIGTLVFLFMKSRPKKEVIETISPLITNISKKTVATGSVIPRKEVEIKPKVSGIISEIFVLPGQKIKSGDVIAKIRIIPNMVSINEAESRLERAHNNLNETKTIFERQKKLYAEKVISEAEYEQSLNAYKNSETELNAAENNLQLIKEGVTKNTKNETNTLVKSTIDGTVLDVPVKSGSQVIEANTFNAGTTIASIADMGDMIFQGKVDETEVGKLKKGMPLILTIGAIDNVTFDAILEYIAPKGILENGAIQFDIKANVKLIDSIYIRANYSANADIVLEKRDSVLSIPETVLQFEKEKSFVEVETKKDEFKKVYIKTGLSDGLNIEIIEGISIKDMIKKPK